MTNKCFIIMRINQRLQRLATLLALTILVGPGCKNEVVQTPEKLTVLVEPNQKGCRDGTCCDQSDKIAFGYDETLLGEPVVLSGPPYGSWGLGFGRQVPKVSDTPAPNRNAVICELCYDKVKQLPITQSVIDQDTTFKPDYRVWGRIYTSNLPTPIRGPIRFVYIERIERMN